MSANDKQVGGEHYKGTYQHWDFVVETRMHYLLACATKYITRHKQKNGRQDLEKSIHYIEKFYQEASKPINKLRKFFPWLDFVGGDGSTGIQRYVEHDPQFKRTVDYFCVANDLGEEETKIIKYICTQPTDFFEPNLIRMVEKLIETEYGDTEEIEDTKNIHVREV